MGPSVLGTAQRRVLAIVPAVLVVLVGALAYQRARSVVGDVRDVERSHAVIESSDAILTRAVDAETGQRGYLLTSDDVFLGPYIGARQTSSIGSTRYKLWCSAIPPKPSGSAK